MLINTYLLNFICPECKHLETPSSELEQREGVVDSYNPSVPNGHHQESYTYFVRVCSKCGAEWEVKP